MDRDRINKVWEAIDELSESYSFLSFIQEHRLDEVGFRQRTQDYFILCPFHGDKNASLSVNESRRTFHCFACGAGYRYRDFVYRYRKEVLGESITLASLTQEYLNKDERLRKMVGFDNVNAAKVVSAVGFRPRFKIAEPKVSYLDVLEKCDESDKLFAISLAQRGVPANRILQEIKDTKTLTSKKYSLEELNTDEYS